LLKRVWPDTFVEEGSLARNISTLRKVLGKGQEGAEYIETIPKRGYRLVAPVRRISGHVDAAAPAADVRDELLAVAPVPSRGWRRAGVAAATLAILVLGGAAWWNSGKSREERPAVGAISTVRSIAVLPLRNLSGADQEYFSDGITEELITTLAQIGSLRVISGTSTMRYKDTRTPLPEIAKALGVDAVFVGSVQRDGDRVRVIAQLIDGRTDMHLGARAYDERLADVLTLQADVARRIADQVQLRLSAQETRRLSASRAVNPGAYDELLRGQAYRWRGFSEFPRALEHYGRAAAIDPTYAQAYAGLAHTWAAVAEPGSIAAARTAAMRALELDPSLPEAHAALAAVKYREWDWEGGHAESRLALEANPGALAGWFYFALNLATTGQLGEAMTIADQAILSNPLSGAAYHVRGNAFLFSRRYDDAVADYRRGLELDPGYTINRWSLASVYDEMGRPGDAIALLEPHAAQAPEGLLLAAAYAHAGRRSDARRLLERLMGKYQTLEAIHVARVYLALGEREQGLAWIERSVRARMPRAQFMLMPTYDSVRQEPRFRAQVKQLRMPASFQAAEKAAGHQASGG
jgi:TolB-like protein/Tfp pilus assembly protein PilF